MDRAAATIRMEDDHPHQSVADLRSQVTAAVVQGDVQGVFALLQNCEDHIRDEILPRDEYEDSLLETAVEHRQINIVRRLVQWFYVNRNVMTPYPSEVLENALFHAIGKGDEDMVQTLVELGANVNYLSGNESPLIAACYHKNISMMNVLKQLGADVKGNLQACGGLKYLLELFGTPLGLSVLHWLLDNGADINFQDKDGYTILHVAAAVGSRDLVRELLRKQARILPDKWGITPIILAVDGRGNKIKLIGEFMRSDAISREEKINAMEYEAASLAPTRLECAYELLHEAWRERMKKPILWKRHCERVAAFGDVMESRSLQELKKKENNNFAIVMECLAIQHRLLGGGTGKMQKTRNFYAIWKFFLSKNKYAEAMALAEHGIGSRTSIWTEKIFNTLLESPEIGNLSVFERGLKCCINILRGSPRDIETYITFGLKLLNRCIELNPPNTVLEHAVEFLTSFPLEGPRFCSALHAATYLMIKEKLDLPSYKAVVELLLLCNAAINEQDSWRCTVLAYVLRDMKPGESQREIDKFLRQKGAKPSS